MQLLCWGFPSFWHPSKLAGDLCSASQELKLRHRELGADEVLSMGPCYAFLGKEH